MTNPIRAMLEKIKMPENSEKELIDLSIGKGYNAPLLGWCWSLTAGPFR